MVTIENLFYIRNYTDTKGKPEKSASFKVVRKAGDGIHDILTLKAVIDGHIDFSELTSPSGLRIRELLEEKLLEDYGYRSTGSEEDQGKSRIVGIIIDSLISGKGLDHAENKRIIHSPQATTRIEKYTIWRDDSYE